MKKIMILLFVSLFSFSVNSNAKSITLGWAAWDPANALQELTKEFTAETGIEVNFEFVPWPWYKLKVNFYSSFSSKFFG